MNTYEFQYKCLREYVERFNLFSVECLPGYLSKIELDRALRFMDDYALNEIQDEAIRVYSNKFISSFSDTIMEFIRRFEFAEVQFKLRNPFDERWDFVCCYKSDKYFIISPILLSRNIFAIEKLSKWCHGQETIFKFFFNYPIPDKYKNNYDNYMSYKIIDILITNSYIVPNQKWENEYIPRANIGDYLDDGFLCKQYGDLDAVFYSPHTYCIYIIEFKNVQMTPSRFGDLSYDIKKMKKWDIDRHVKEREEVIRNNISEFINRVFKSDAILIQNNKNVEVKSIVLTTTPNFYFYQYPSDVFLCMDWIEFRERVTEREL